MDFNNIGGPRFGGRGGERPQFSDEQKAEWQAKRAERRAKWEAMSPEDRAAARPGREHCGPHGAGHRGGQAFGNLSALLQQAQQQ